MTTTTKAELPERLFIDKTGNVPSESECYCADYTAAKGSCAHCMVRAALNETERPA